MMDTLVLTVFCLTDMVESVADPDWKKGGVYSFGLHTYLQSTIFMTTPTNDEGYLGL